MGRKKLIDAAAADRALGATQERINVPEDLTTALSAGSIAAVRTKLKEIARNTFVLAETMRVSGTPEPKGDLRS